MAVRKCPTLKVSCFEKWSILSGLGSVMEVQPPAAGRGRYEKGFKALITKLLVLSQHVIYMGRLRAKLRSPISFKYGPEVKTTLPLINLWSGI